LAFHKTVVGHVLQIRVLKPKGTGSTVQLICTDSSPHRLFKERDKDDIQTYTKSRSSIYFLCDQLWQKVYK